MKKGIITLLFVFLFSSIAFPQFWDTTITAGSIVNDAGNKVKFDSEGNMVVNGYCSGLTSFGSTSFDYVGGFVAKYDSQGNFLWVIKAGDNLSYTAINKQASGSIELDNNDNIYVTGNFADTAQIGLSTVVGNSSDKNIFLAKISPAGNVLWTKYVTGNSVSTGIAVDTDKSIAICGYTEGVSTFDGNTITPFGSSPRDAIFAKYDSVGVLQWVRQAGGPGTFGDRAFDVEFDLLHNVWVCGYIRSNSSFGSLNLSSTAPSNSYYNGFLTKYSSSGNSLWVGYCGGSPVSLGVNSANQICVAGYAGPDNGFDSIVNPTADDLFVAQLENNGTYMWASTASGPGVSGACDLTIDDNDNIYIAGHFTDILYFPADTLFGNPGGIWYSKAFASKYSVTGLNQWAISAGGLPNSQCYGFGIDVKDTCSIAVCGSFETPSPVIFADTVTSTGGYDFFLATIHQQCFNCTPSSNSLTINACNQYQSPSGSWYFSSQNITDTVMNSMGCDSVIFIALNITNPNTNVMQDSVSLSSLSVGSSYQWVDCDDNMNAIVGANSQTFSPLLSGNYAVIVTESGCTDTSSCYTFNTLGLSNELLLTNGFIYPNPSSGIIYFNLAGNTVQQVILYNSIGKVVYETLSNVETIDLSSYSDGTYYVQIISHEQIRWSKLILLK